jgi:hypothetical protein
MPLKRQDFKQCAVIARMRSGLTPAYLKGPKHEIFMQFKSVRVGDLVT